MHYKSSTKAAVEITILSTIAKSKPTSDWNCDVSTRNDVVGAVVFCFHINLQNKVNSKVLNTIGHLEWIFLKRKVFFEVRLNKNGELFTDIKKYHKVKN